MDVIRNLLDVLKGLLTKALSSYRLHSCVALQSICNEVHPGAEEPCGIQVSPGC